MDLEPVPDVAGVWCGKRLRHPLGAYLLIIVLVCALPDLCLFSHMCYEGCRICWVEQWLIGFTCFHLFLLLSALKPLSPHHSSPVLQLTLRGKTPELIWILILKCWFGLTFFSLFLRWNQSQWNPAVLLFPSTWVFLLHGSFWFCKLNKDSLTLRPAFPTPNSKRWCSDPVFIYCSSLRPTAMLLYAI